MDRARASANHGFTLIELVSVIVIMSIVAVIGSGFIIKTTESYHQANNRAQLIQTGRQAIERVTRELRIAVPSSVRVSANSLCVEWLPIVAGANYLSPVSSTDNAAAASATISVAPVSENLDDARFVSVGALASGDLYGSSPSSLERFNGLDTSAIPNVLSLGSAKTFARNSVNKRVFISGAPKQFCVANSRLTLHENYTSAGTYPSATFSGSPPNAGSLLALGIELDGNSPFGLEAGTQALNTIVNIQLPFAKGGERIVLEHQVMVRNVP